MLWKLLLAMASVISSPFRAPDIPGQRYEVTPYGPQNLQDAMVARRALQGERDDILYAEDDDPSYAGIKGSQFRWPGYPGSGVVAYEMDEDVKADENLTRLIIEGMKQYHDNTCIRFVERTNETKYVLIIKTPFQCYSHVGMVPRPQPQPLSLGEGCQYIGTVVHELGHAIGFYHEHQRSDRDNYVIVHEENVAEGALHNFNKTEKEKEVIRTKYNYECIMHYGECAFAKEGEDCYFDRALFTMEAKDKKHRLKDPYERPGLSQKDIEMVKKLYKCQ